jgi:phage shock protein A
MKNSVIRFDLSSFQLLAQGLQKVGACVLTTKTERRFTMNAILRVANVIRAEVDEVLNKLEDPKKMVRQMVLNMEQALDDAIAAVGRAVANEKMLERQIGQKKEDSEQWGRKAEAAVEAGEEELARKALFQKVAVDEAVEALEQAHGEAQEVTGALKQRLTELKAKLESARLRQGALVMRKGAAQLRSDMREDAGILNSEAFSRFDQFCQDVAKEEVAAQVYAEVTGGGAPQLDEQFDRLEQKQRVEAEIQALKDKAKGTVQNKTETSKTKS